MSTSAQLGFGTRFKLAGSYLADVNAINPSVTFDDVDVTDLDSPSSGTTVYWNEYIKGRGSAEITLDMNWRPDTHKSDVMTLITTSAAQTCRIEWKDGTNWTFSGLVNGSDIDGPVDKMGNTVRIRVTGSINFDGV
jgi:hypothetical protein